MTVAYLSRIWINPRRKQGQRFLRDPQSLHAAVLAGVPAQPVNERVLWRLDADDDLRPGLLVLTETQPSWEHLVEQAGWPSAHDPADPAAMVRPYGPLLDRLEAGGEFAFRLTANPVKSTPPVQRVPGSDKRHGRSRRVPQVTVEQQLAWLTDRSERLGFSIPSSSSSEAMREAVPDVRISNRSRQSFSRGKGKGAPVTLHLVTFEGRLQVDDPAVFREHLVRGIGPAKAYGCGLMTLAPLPNRDG